MGLLGTPYRSRQRRFKLRDEVEDNGRRVHFRDLSPYKRSRGRSLLFLLVMIGFVIYMLFYLAKVKG